MRISGSVQHVFLRPSDRNADTGTATVVAPAGTIFRSSSSPSETRSASIIELEMAGIQTMTGLMVNQAERSDWSSKGGTVGREVGEPATIQGLGIDSYRDVED